jgi:hydrogenase maturation protein HypF
LGLINGLTEMAFSFSMLLDIHHVALSGGVMQNLTLARELPLALQGAGLLPLVHTQLPPNDGCISLGQAAWGLRRLLNEA